MWSLAQDEERFGDLLSLVRAIMRLKALRYSIIPSDAEQQV